MGMFVTENANKNIRDDRRIKFYDDFISGSILEDAAERGAEIIAVSAALYMGSIEQAMNFAQSRGGGGSTPGTDWGRKPDEDDESFRSRCFHMARMMMRPPQQRKHYFHR